MRQGIPLISVLPARTYLKYLAIFLAVMPLLSIMTGRGIDVVYIGIYTAVYIAMHSAFWIVGFLIMAVLSGFDRLR